MSVMFYGCPYLWKYIQPISTQKSLPKPCFTNTQFSRFCGFSRDVRAPGKCRSDPFAKNSSTDELTVYLVYDRISIKTTLLFLFEYFKHITATFTSTNKLFHTIRYLPNCAVVLTFLLVKPVSNRVVLDVIALLP